MMFTTILFEEFRYHVPGRFQSVGIRVPPTKTPATLRSSREFDSFSEGLITQQCGRWLLSRLEAYSSAASRCDRLRPAVRQ